MKNNCPITLTKWKKEQDEREYQTLLDRQRAKLEPAFLEDRAVKVLELLSFDDHTGETIYKIYELLEGHPNNRAEFQSSYGISKDQFSRFKDVVHNPTVSGYWARHAYEGEPKTLNPMSKREAELFVREIANRWLVSIRQEGGGN